MNYPKPKILVSACLEFEKVRYDGQVIPCKIVRDLMPFVDFIKVCPEVEIGLGVPREPIRIVKKNKELRLIQHKTEKDLTDDMNEFTKTFLDNLDEVDGFIFKEESPSMGAGEIKVYSDIELGSAVVEWCGSFFGGEVVRRYSGYSIEEAKRLKHKKIRQHFLTKLYFFAGLREAEKSGQVDKFVEENALLLEFYNSDKNVKTSRSNYLDSAKKIFSKPPTVEAIQGFFMQFVAEVENKEEYRKLLKNYKINKIDYNTLFEGTKLVIKNKNILQDRFFSPYPAELIMLADDGRKRDYWKNK